jgi:CRISPR-associated protein Csd1
MVFASQDRDGSYFTEEGTTMSSIQLANADPAYLCGRLLAVLDEVQYAALGSVNATIIDKYYGAASTAPASVFGTLIHNAQNHLGKLMGIESRRGAYIALDQKLQDILYPLSEFPATLSLPAQGLFALGFYHQRAESRREREARREAKKADAAE